MDDRKESCESKLGSDIRCSFSWTIGSFKTCKEKNGDEKYSETFYIYLPDGKVTSWNLLLYPKGRSNYDDGNVSVYLTSENDFDIRTQFSLSYLDPSGKKEGTAVVNEYIFSGKDWYSGFTSLIKSNEIQELNEQDKLTIFCDMIVYCPDTIIGNDCNDEDYHADLSDYFSRLFSHGEHSDVKIICGEKTFSCHKSILSARSSVFEAMFQADMEEKKENKVEIKDFSPEVIENMLMFIYGAKTPSESSLKKEDGRDQISELLKAADQYDVELLKIACDQILCASLSIENCLISLIIADMYQAEKLRKLSMKMLVENMRTVVTKNSEDWKKFVKSHPDLTIEITEELSKRTK